MKWRSVLEERYEDKDGNEEKEGEDREEGVEVGPRTVISGGGHASKFTAEI